jgi:uncharacterized protein involved in exopolysaccharide biosynthesis
VFPLGKGWCDKHQKVESNFQKGFYMESKIVLKVLKKHWLEICLLAIVVTFAVVCYPFSYSALASEQIALISVDKNLVENGNVQTLSSNSFVFSDADTNSFALSDEQISLSSKSYLEYVYVIENITQDTLFAGFTLEKQEMKNLKLTYQIDNGATEIFDNAISFEIEKSQVLKVVICLKIQDVSRNSCLSGVVDLNLSQA